MNRYLIMLKLIELSMFKSSGLKKAEFLRKKQIFENMGKIAIIIL